MLKLSAISELRLLVLAGLAMSVLSYVTNILLANVMGPDLFGEYSYALVLGALFGQLVLFGTAEVGIKLKINHGEEALDWILTLKIINFLLLFIATLVSSWITNNPAPLFGLVVALSTLSFATQYEAHGKNVRYATIFLVERVLITAMIWLGLLVLDAYYIVWVFGTLALFQGASLCFQYLENRQTRVRFAISDLLKVYREGSFVLLFGLSKFLFGGSTRILIFHQLGEERMGVFAAAWQFVPLSTLYFAQTTRTWRLRITESLSDGNGFEFWQHVKALSLVAMIPSLLAAGVFFAFGDRIIALAFSSDYSDAGSLLRYIGIYFLIIGFDSVVVLLAIANSQARLASMVYLLFGGLTILAYLFLAKNLGLEGYISIMVAGHFCASIVLALFVKRSIDEALK